MKNYQKHSVLTSMSTHTNHDTDTTTTLFEIVKSTVKLASQSPGLQYKSTTIPVLSQQNHKMPLINTFLFTLPLLLLVPSEVTSKTRTYYFQNEWANYQQAWETCKAKGLQLATAESLEDYNELGRVLNRPEYKGEFFWSTDGNVHIDRNIDWPYITFNDEEMTLISATGQKVKTRCTLVTAFRHAGTDGTEWSFDLCTQTHRYFCDSQ